MWWVEDERRRGEKRAVGRQHVDPRSVVHLAQGPLLRLQLVDGLHLEGLLRVDHRVLGRLRRVVGLLEHLRLVEDPTQMINSLLDSPRNTTSTNTAK